MRLIFALAIAVMLLASGCILGGGKYDEFAKCLTNKSVKMYGAYWCGHCNNQKTEFGSSWQYMTYVECAVQGQPDVQTDACREANITGYPTWELPDGTRIEGEMAFAELSDKTGCALPSGG